MHYVLERALFSFVECCQVGAVKNEQQDKNNELKDLGFIFIKHNLTLKVTFVYQDMINYIKN